MRDGAIRERSWTVLIGPLLSALAGLGVSLYFENINSPPGLDIVAGLVTGLVGLQLDIGWRLHRRETEHTRQARLIEDMEQIPWLPEVVSDLVHYVQRVEVNHGGTLVSTAMRHTLLRCASTLSDFERGRFTTDFDDNAWVFRLTEGVRKTLLASSVQDIDLNFWHSPAGQYYWNLQQRKLEAGVSIRRIFIFRDWTAQLDNLARKQATAGVHVMRVQLSRVPKRLCKDLIVWDGTVAYETRVNAAGDADENLFSVDREDVARLVEQLDLVQSLAEDYVPSSDTGRDVVVANHADHSPTPSPQPHGPVDSGSGDDEAEGTPSRR